MQVSSFFLAAIVCFADGPKQLSDYFEDGIGYAHSITPVQEVLSLEETERWAEILEASEAQRALILAKFEVFWKDHHNPYTVTAVPAYLRKAAAAADIAQARGTTSDEFRAALDAADQAGKHLRDSVARLELQFIDSLAPALDAHQTETLEVFRNVAARRKHRTIPTTSRWVNLELRSVWEALPQEFTTTDNRIAIHGRLAEYERELTSLVGQWSAARLAAGRKVQRYLRDYARGEDDPSFDPERTWATAARLTKRMRGLHLRVAEELLAVLPPKERELARVGVKGHIFPELYPDPTHAATISEFERVATDGQSGPDSRGTAATLHLLYCQRYKEICERLEAACATWDDDVEAGVGRAVPQGLTPAVGPLLLERAALSQEFLLRCQEETGTKGAVEVLTDAPPTPAIE